MAKRKPYTEAGAKTDVRAALEDLESAAVKLRGALKRIRTLPSWKRVNDAWKKGDESAGSFSWWLVGSCDEVARDLEENHIPNLRKDLRETDASVEAHTKRVALELTSAKANPEKEGNPTLSDTLDRLAQAQAALTRALQDLAGAAEPPQEAA